MKTRIWKEVRSISSGAVISVLAVGALLVLPGHTDFGMIVVVLLLGSGLMGGGVFGHEFSQRTLPLLLAQGVERSRIWREKMLVLAAFLMLFFGLAVLAGKVVGLNWQSPDGETAIQFIWLIPLSCFCTVPFWTLFARNGLGGILFALMFPPFAYGGASLLSERIFPEFFKRPENDALLTLIIQCVTLAYSFLLYHWGRAKFRTMEIKDGAGEDLQLPKRLGEFFSNAFERCWQGKTGPMVALIKKEIRLQKLSFIIAAVFVAAYVLVIVAKAAGSVEFAETAMVSVAGIYFSILPLLVGAISTAEERNLGTLEGQLVLPLGTRKQWTLKCVMAWVVCLTLGFAAHGFGAMVGWVAGVPIAQQFFHEISAGSLGIAACQQSLVLALVVYASTLSRNSMKAMLLGIALFVVGGCIYGVLLEYARHFLRGDEMMIAGRIYAIKPLAPPIAQEVIVWGLTAGTILFTLFILWLGYSNFRFSDRRPARLVAHAFAVGCGLLLWMVPQLIGYRPNP